MGYTKGEWKIEDGTQVVCGDRLVANTGGYTTNYSLERETNIANAYLISAAPEMYEALQSCLALLDKQREEYNSAPTILPHEPVGEGGIAKAARKALTKADGREV